MWRGAGQGFLEATAFALGLEGRLEFGLADKGINQKSHPHAQGCVCVLSCSSKDDTDCPFCRQGHWEVGG